MTNFVKMEMMNSLQQYSAALLLLLSTIASGYAGGCANSRPSSISDLTMDSGVPTEARPPDSEQSFIQQWIFPGMRFTCSGNLTSWIFRAENTTDIRFAFNPSPRFEVWSDDSIPQNNYIRRHTATEQPELIRYQGSVYEYTLPTPLPVEENDFVGILYPVAGFENVKVLFLDKGEGNAPVSYRRNQNEDLFQALDMNLVTPDARYVPLVSAIFGETVMPSETSTTLPLSTPTEPAFPHDATTSSLQPTPSVTVTPIPPPNIVTAEPTTSNLQPTPSVTPRRSIITGAATVAAAAVLVIVFITVMVVMLKYYKRSNSRVEGKGETTCGREELRTQQNKSGTTPEAITSSHLTSSLSENRAYYAHLELKINEAYHMNNVYESIHEYDYIN